MQYLGGKSRIASKIAKVIGPKLTSRPWWDPFCGGLSISVALSAYGPGVASDIHPSLIALYRAVWGGWVPPSLVSLEEYQAARKLPDKDPMKAFCGFGCSFGGKWFGGYARKHGARRNYSQASASSRVLQQDIKILKEREIYLTHLDFFKIPPQPDLVLYCDPPYRGTTSYGQAFDHDAFLTRILEWAKVTDVFVSEYNFPGHIIWESPHELRVRGGATKLSDQIKTEKLFHLGP